MKKAVLVSIGVLALLLMVAPVRAPATKTSVTGEHFGYFISPGKQWTSEEGIMQIRNGVGNGTLTGDIPGMMIYTVNAAFDPTIGEGRIWGKFVASDNYGNTFEGKFLASISDWGNNLEGKAEGHGTGAYEGMLLVNRFWGYNAYFGPNIPPYPKGTPIYFYYEGSILTPAACVHQAPAWV